MRALVQPAVVEVEAESRHQALAQRLLAGGRERPGQRQGRALAGQHPLEKVRQKGRERREQAIDLGRGEARLVALEQGIVGGEAQSLGFRRRLLARKSKNLLQRL